MVCNLRSLKTTSNYSRTGCEVLCVYRRFPRSGVLFHGRWELAKYHGTSRVNASGLAVKFRHRSRLDLYHNLQWISAYCDWRGNLERHKVWFHYNDVIMNTISSQITSPAIVYQTVRSGPDQRKHQSSIRVTGLCAGNSPGTGEFPIQMASNAANVSIWWRHHAMITSWNGNAFLITGITSVTNGLTSVRASSAKIWFSAGVCRNKFSKNNQIAGHQVIYASY